jgi:transposase
LGLFLSLIAAGLFNGPGWLPEHEVRMRKAGSKKIGEHTMAVAGIDTGKDWLDVSVCGVSKTWRVANDEAGHAALLAELLDRGIERVGIEASGGYERDVVRHLRQGGLAVAVLQPRQVRAYADFRLRRAKSDPIDAALIATCTAALEDIRPAPDPRFETLAERLTMIEQIEEDLARAKIRLEAFRQAELRERLRDDIRRHARERAQQLKQLLAAVRQEADLAGLAPFDDDSGRHHGQRHIAGGRERVRKSLYAAALPAAFRWNPALVIFYGRLKAAGKPHKLALVACARKLLIFANAVLQRGTPWIVSHAAI